MDDKKRELANRLGLLIKRRRIELNLSQEEVTWKSGLSKNTYCSIELAKSDTKLTTILSIFSVLELDLSEVTKIWVEILKKNSP